MRIKTATAVACLLALVAPAMAQAEDGGLVAVLPLNAPKLDKDLRETLEEDIRTVAGDYLRTRGYRVLTGETTLQYAEDNGLDPTKVCEASCALKAARELKATLFISGSATEAEDEYVAFVRLYDTKTQQQLGSVKLEGAKVKDLRGQFEQKADELFQAVGQGSAPVVNGTTTTTQTTTSEPPPEVTATAPHVKKGKVTAAVGTLTVSARPKELVRIDIEDPDGRKVSSGIPYENPNAKPGTYKVTAKASGYGDEQQTVVVSPDDVTLVKFDLKLLGKLSIQGTPQGAAVTVTGPEGFHDDGGLPWEADGLHAGMYSVRVSREGYTDENSSTEVKPGETATVQITLQKAAVVAATPASTAVPVNGTNAAPAEAKKWRLGLNLGLAGFSEAGMVKIDADVENRFTPQFSYFADVGLGIVPGTASILGLNYSIGLRWYIIGGFHLGALLDAALFTASSSGISTTTTLYAVDAEVGYLLEFGSFVIGLEARAGYATSPTSSATTSSTTSSSAGGVSYGVNVAPGFRF